MAPNEQAKQHRSLGERLWRYGAIGAAGLAAFTIYEAIENPGFFAGSTPPVGQSEVIPGTTSIGEINLQCNGSVTEAVGSVAVSHYKVGAWKFKVSIGGYVSDEAIPVEYLECTPGGIDIADEVTSVNGKVTHVTVPELNYKPYYVNVTDLNPLICSGLSSKASAKEIKAAENSNDKGDCGGHTTGIGTDAKGAASTEELARRDADIVAIMTPPPKKIWNNFEKDVDKRIIKQVNKRYPGATVTIVQPAPQAPIDQMVAGLDAIKPDLKKDFTSISFSRVGNQTEMEVSSVNATGTEIINMPLDKQDIRTLNNEVS